MDDKYVNFYQTPGDDTITSAIFNSREEADHAWNSRWDHVREANRVSRKQRVACIRVPVICIFGQFDM